MANYRIEKRVAGQPTEYWLQCLFDWTTDVNQASIYPESYRTAHVGLPPGGCWVCVDNEHCPTTGHPITDCGCPRHRITNRSESAATLTTYGPSYPWLCKRPHPPDGRPYFNSKDSVKCQGCGWPYVGKSDIRPSSGTVRYGLTEIRAAILAVIAAGDPTTPRDGNGKPIWSTRWLLYAAGKGEGFADAVAELLTKGSNQ